MYKHTKDEPPTLKTAPQQGDEVTTKTPDSQKNYRLNGNNKVNKPVLITASVIAGVILIASFVFFMFPESQIRLQVVMNMGELDLIGRSYFENLTAEELDAIADIEDDGQVYPGDHHIVQFSAEPIGFTKSGTFYGYYYSPDDMPVPFNNLDTELVEISENVWEWDIFGTNYGKTVKITEGWYYFDATF